jgi:hypothetical protein
MSHPNNIRPSDYPFPQLYVNRSAPACNPAPCTKISDLLPPPEIIEAAEKVRVWMETNGYRNWQLGGICDRRLAERHKCVALYRLAEIHRYTGTGTDAEWARDKAHKLSSP